jgi:lipoprotein NlpI
MKNGSEYVIEWTIHAQCELDAMYDYSERNRSVSLFDNRQSPDKLTIVSEL